MRISWRVYAAITVWASPEVFAKKKLFCYVVLDPIKRAVIEGKNTESRIFPASLAKLMTLFITFDAVKVRPLIQRLKQNRVNIIFHIEEGHRSYNKQIRFLMDAKDPGFSESALRDVITSLEDRWWRILGDPAECYDKARVEYDCDLLRKHYYRNGYLDVRVTAHTQLAKNREHFYITFFIHEGPQYCISDINIKSDLKNLNLDGLETHITLKKGSVFNAEMPEKVASRMAQELEMRGLSFLEVRTMHSKSRDDTP